MHTKTSEDIIPGYSLHQTTGGNATDFSVFQADGVTDGRQPFFLLPHRKEFYMFVFVEQGDNRHWVDMRPYTLQPDTFYFTTPNQVHLKESMAAIKGTSLCFTDTFLNMGDPELKRLPIIQNRLNGHVLILEATDILFIKNILQQVTTEYAKDSEWKNGMLHGYLRILIIYLSRLYVKQYEGTTADTSLLRRFQELVNTHHLQLHDVASYADRLNISPGYLGEAIKEQSGKPPIDWIHDRLLVEAKRLLLYTDLSVKELSFQLGFSDVSYFVRFFKRLTTETPVAYRNSIRKMYHPNV